MRKDRLIGELEKLKLETTGTKDELADRIWTYVSAEDDRDGKGTAKVKGIEEPESAWTAEMLMKKAKPTLSSECAARKLRKTGNKRELVERLIRYQEAHPPEPIGDTLKQMQGLVMETGAIMKDKTERLINIIGAEDGEKTPEVSESASMDVIAYIEARGRKNILRQKKADLIKSCAHFLPNRNLSEMSKQTIIDLVFDTYIEAKSLPENSGTTESVEDQIPEKEKGSDDQETAQMILMDQAKARPVVFIGDIEPIIDCILHEMRLTYGRYLPVELEEPEDEEEDESDLGERFMAASDKNLQGVREEMESEIEDEDGDDNLADAEEVENPSPAEIYDEQETPDKIIEEQETDAEMPPFEETVSAPPGNKVEDVSSLIQPTDAAREGSNEVFIKGERQSRADIPQEDRTEEKEAMVERFLAENNVDLNPPSGQRPFEPRYSLEDDYYGRRDLERYNAAQQQKSQRAKEAEPDAATDEGIQSLLETEPVPVEMDSWGKQEIARDILARHANEELMRMSDERFVDVVRPLDMDIGPFREAFLAELSALADLGEKEQSGVDLLELSLSQMDPDSTETETRETLVNGAGDIPIPDSQTNALPPPTELEGVQEEAVNQNGFLDEKLPEMTNSEILSTVEPPQESDPAVALIESESVETEEETEIDGNGNVAETEELLEESPKPVAESIDSVTSIIEKEFGAISAEVDAEIVGSEADDQTTTEEIDESQVTLMKIERILRELKRQRVEFTANTRDFQGATDMTSRIQETDAKKESLDNEIRDMSIKYNELSRSVQGKDVEIEALRHEINRVIDAYDLLPLAPLIGDGNGEFGVFATFNPDPVATTTSYRFSFDETAREYTLHDPTTIAPFVPSDPAVLDQYNYNLTSAADAEVLLRTPSDTNEEAADQKPAKDDDPLKKPSAIVASVVLGVLEFLRGMSGNGRKRSEG